MRHRPIRLFVLSLTLLSPAAFAQDIAEQLTEATAELATTTYRLTYKFKQGEVLRYAVEHLATVDTRISGNKQVSRSRSASTKAWTVNAVTADTIEFTHRVEDVEMWKQDDGREEVRYNSLTDSKPPAEYEHVAESIGKPLAVVTIDRTGQIIKRNNESSQPDLGFGGLVVPLPKGEIKLGHSWVVPKKLRLRTRDGLYKEVNTQMRYRLEQVKLDVATISVKTEVLTPINDSTLKSQLVQQLSDGEIKFDLDAGRVISKQLDWSETVIGFNGPDSNMKYLARFTEKLKSADAQTARKPTKSRS